MYGVKLPSCRHSEHLPPILRMVWLQVDKVTEAHRGHAAPYPAPSLMHAINAAHLALWLVVVLQAQRVVTYLHGQVVVQIK